MLAFAVVFPITSLSADLDVVSVAVDCKEAEGETNPGHTLINDTGEDRGVMVWAAVCRGGGWWCFDDATRECLYGVCAAIEDAESCKQIAFDFVGECTSESMPPFDGFESRDIFIVEVFTCQYSFCNGCDTGTMTEAFCMIP